MASMAPQTPMLPLQQIAVPPAPAPTPQITASSDGIFKINWFQFRDHVRRAQTDNQSGDMLTDVTICCRNQGDVNWAYFNASKGVLLSGCAELREEILVSLHCMFTVKNVEKVRVRLVFLTFVSLLKFSCIFCRQDQTIDPFILRGRCQ